MDTTQTTGLGYTITPVNPQTSRITWRGVDLGRLYLCRPTHKKSKPQFRLVDLDMLNVIPGSPLHQQLRKPFGESNLPQMLEFARKHLRPRR
jgi:hypothetical protein